ncbi:type VII secretion integral membrane protein EccD [Catenulispora sp. NF23]|uniref:type VII secretion integral membrane protein EccD n=1 Tax=Catenulispora pinistramenti TaxID=2705254 RepID=UPI001BA47054|nr:type VII secretion integral membrane protein EccD [Catenulispora pinistramenti]MBS2538421.1 type VII secretion integral membrane protein EccD [Catenulispora pinistramenti]
MTTTTVPASPTAWSASEVCRVTVAGPAKRADLAVPVTATVGELLPLLLRHTVDGTDRDGAWVLQRLGGPPLDPGATPESLDLHDGDILYLNREDGVLPEISYDDLAVGVAQTVGARRDQWRPVFTRRLLIGAATVPLAGIAVLALGLASRAGQVVALAGTALVLAGAAALVSRLLDDRGAGLLTGLSACGFAVLTGLAARHGLAGVLGPDWRDLQLAGACGAFVAAAVPAGGWLPIDPFGVIAGTGFASAVGAALAAGLHWDATRAAAVLAAVLFVLTMNVRFVLRAAHLRVPQLPQSAAELQQDIEPASARSVQRRAETAISFLNSLYISASLVFTVAIVLLADGSGWAGRTLAGALSVAVLLRARSLTLAWQRVPLTAAGSVGAVAVLLLPVLRGSATAYGVAILVLAVASGTLLALARRPAAQRLLPVWGHLADLLETWTALAVLPILLQFLHVYARMRALAG